jgi:hypothetical protein
MDGRSPTASCRVPHPRRTVGAAKPRVAGSVEPQRSTFRVLSSGFHDRSRTAPGISRRRSGTPSVATGLLFGAEFVFTRRAAGLSVGGNHLVVELEDEVNAVARAVIIATGVTYRRLDSAGLDRFVGTGVFLWRRHRGSVGDDRTRGACHWRGKLRRSGRVALSPIRQPRYAAGPWPVTGCWHVRLFDQAA